MKDMSSLLNERIFLTCFHPRNCLLKVSEICGLMQEQLELLPYATLVHLSLQEFKKISEQHLEQGIIHRMKQDVDNIVEHLQQAIAEVILKFKEENNIKI